MLTLRQRDAARYLVTAAKVPPSFSPRTANLAQPMWRAWSTCEILLLATALVQVFAGPRAWLVVGRGGVVVFALVLFGRWSRIVRLGMDSLVPVAWFTGLPVAELPEDRSALRAIAFRE